MALPTDLTVDSLALAEALSIAIRIEPQLLRKMRLDLFPTADAGSEADLWFSSIVETRSPLGIVFQKQHADELRQRLQQLYHWGDIRRNCRADAGRGAGQPDA